MLKTLLFYFGRSRALEYLSRSEPDYQLLTIDLRAAYLKVDYLHLCSESCDSLYPPAPYKTGCILWCIHVSHFQTSFSSVRFEGAGSKNEVPWPLDGNKAKADDTAMLVGITCVRDDVAVVAVDDLLAELDSGDEEEPGIGGEVAPLDALKDVDGMTVLVKVVSTVVVFSPPCTAVSGAALDTTVVEPAPTDGSEAWSGGFVVPGADMDELAARLEVLLAVVANEVNILGV